MSVRAAMVFGMLVAAAPSLGRAVTPAYDSGGSGNAARLLDDARRAAHHGRYTQAIDYDNRALALSPSFGAAYLQRAQDFMDSGRYAEATADIDRVVAMHPDDMATAMRRAEIAILQADGRTAKAALKQALTLTLFSAWHQPYEASTYEGG
jgi:tetratricopeptide (TPR) repeat protein